MIAISKIIIAIKIQIKTYDCSKKKEFKKLKKCITL